MSMHAALQFLSQAWQLLHFPVSIIGRKIAKREKKLRIVPTGQMVLQYVLPLRAAKMKMIMNVTAAIINVGILLIHTSL